jgi:hypothetical protein
MAGKQRLNRGEAGTLIFYPICATQRAFKEANFEKMGDAVLFDGRANR